METYQIFTRSMVECGYMCLALLHRLGASLMPGMYFRGTAIHDEASLRHGAIYNEWNVV